jgi:acyl carrier protein
LAEKISIYRKAWKEAGHKGKGILTLMLHTFVGTDEKMVKETVRGPMKHYLKSSVNLVKEAAWSFPVFKNATTGTDGNFSLDHLSSEDLDAVLDYSFERYYQTSGLFGTPESCKKIIKNLKETDVDEIACLIDFGVDSDLVMAHLHYLNQVRREANIQVPVKTGLDKYTIASLIREQKVTHMQCTPSMAQMLVLDEESKESLRSLQTMLIGGEAFPVKLAESLVEVVKGDILNMYGPTETTVWSTVYRLKEPVGKTIPIGKPIANTQIYILDSYRQLVPVGIPGELCIGGDGVTEGYYNRPELTAEKFIENPFSNEENSKLYRTGDLAYYRKDGTIEFLGRQDHQVKIRGYRIELGEIETALSSHEAIREAVVIAREDTPGDVRLVAYVIPQKDSLTDTEELRNYIKGKLPEYMVPSQYLSVESFPLTPNGKIDRKAFPVPSEFNFDTVKKEVVLPTNEMEDRIARVWQDLLKIPKVGINDNFFDIGGHSLLAVQLHSRLKQLIDTELTLIDIFTYPTIKSLEEFVNKRINSEDEIITVQTSKRAVMTKQRINRLKSRNRDMDDNTDIQKN